MASRRFNLGFFFRPQKIPKKMGITQTPTSKWCGLTRRMHLRWEGSCRSVVEQVLRAVLESHMTMTMT
jgi:hypothetical protein